MSAPTSTEGALEVSIHPLVLINISDHFTRVKAQQWEDSKSSSSSAAAAAAVAAASDEAPAHQRNYASSSNGEPRVLGALFGVQQQRKVHVYNTFEMSYDVTPSGQLVIDSERFHKFRDQALRVFANFEVLGWYSTGNGIENGDLEVHKRMTEFNESPLYLVLNPQIDPNAKQLPITLFQSEVHVVNDVPTFTFVNCSFNIEAVEAERISVDHIAKVTPLGGEGSVVKHGMDSLGSAVGALQSRIQTILQFLHATKSGQIPRDHQALRQIKALCNRLPVMDSSQFQNNFYHEYNDAALVAYLAMLTKGTSNFSSLAERFAVCYDRHSRRRW